MRLPLRLSIQSKLLLMLLGVSLLSIGVTAWLGYQNGKKSLTVRVNEELTAQRVVRTTQLRALFHDLRSQTLGLAENPMIAQALKAFQGNFTELQAASLQPAEAQALRAYYEQEFLPSLKGLTEGEPIAENLAPATPAGRVLQYHYLAQNQAAAGRWALDAAPDGSAYSATHAQYHPTLARLMRRFGYHDLFLIGADGNIVYSVAKEIDFGASLTAGALVQTNLARAFRAARDANQKGYYTLVDFERYLPSRTAPAAFTAAPVYENGTLLGVVATQVPSDPIEIIVSGGRNWAKEGLGKTGEVYLVGPDFKMRSDARFLIENPNGYADTLAAAGVPAYQIGRIKTFKTSVLEQEVRTELARRALLNQSGRIFATDYRGVNVLGSYGPSGVDELGWGVVVKMDETEAFAPVNEFGRKVLTSAVLLQLGLTLAALALARLFLRPIEQLVAGAEAVGAGKLDTVVEVSSHDEFHDLASVFNRMTGKLKEQTAKTEATLKQNENLLLNILPGPIAQRLKDGEQQIADAVPSVTVLFASIIGFDDVAHRKAADEAVTLLNELVGALDEVAERLGVEKVKTVGTSYLAVTGLNIPAIDHPRRMLEFALELRNVVRGFNQRHATNLQVRVGVNSGPVMGGVVGRSKFIYDLWGDTVSLAQALEHAGQPDSIVVSDSTYQRSKDDFAFKRAADVQVAGKGAQTMYELAADA